MGLYVDNGLGGGLQELYSDISSEGSGRKGDDHVSIFYPKPDGKIQKHQSISNKDPSRKPQNVKNDELQEYQKSRKSLVLTACCILLMS
jgi:hypothetical protein